MTARALILADETTQSWLAGFLGDMALTAVDSIEDLMLKTGDGALPRLVFIQTDADDVAERLKAFSRLSGQHGDLPCIAVAHAADSATVMAAMRGGATEFFLRGQDDDRIPELVANTLKKGASLGKQSSQVISILSGHADTGLAFLAEHLALAIAEKQRQNEAVLLLDIASPAGAAAVFMNIQHDYSALDAIDDAYRCDATLVDTAFPRHNLGPYVLSLPETLHGDRMIDAEKLSELLDVLAGMFASIIVCADLGVGDACIQKIAERTSHSLILSDQSILYSRHNQQLLRTLRGAGISMDHAGLVVDRYQRRVGLEPDKLSELLQLPLYAVLAGDSASRVKAMNTGESLLDTSPGDEYLRDVRRLAQQLLGRSQVVMPKRGLLDRLLS